MSNSRAVYLTVIKGRSENTIKEYRTDLLMFFDFVLLSRNRPIHNKNFTKVDFGIHTNYFA